LAQSQQAGQRGAQPGQQGRGQPAQGGPAGTAAPGQAAAVGGIIGVTSKSTAESIRLYKGRSHYNEWAFIYTPPAVAPGGAGGVATPGGRGRGQGAGQQGPQPIQTPSQGAGNPARGGRGQGVPNPARGTFPSPFPGGQ